MAKDKTLPSITQIKAKMARDVHDVFSLFVVYVEPNIPSGGDVADYTHADVEMRFHPEQQKVGELDRGNYAELVELIPVGVFLAPIPLWLKKNGVVTLPDGKKYALVSQLPQVNAAEVAFELKGVR